MSTTTHTNTNPAPCAGVSAQPAGLVRVVPAEVFDLFARIKQLEQGDRSWPGGDVVSVLCAWFSDHGIDPGAPVSRYRPAHPSVSPVESTDTGTAQTVHLVHRETFDGLYLFEDPDQASEYAGLFDGAETGTQTVINRSAGAQLIIDSQPCSDCGDQRDCQPCPLGDPGCEAMDCQDHDTCLSPIPTGTQVRLLDEDPTDQDGPPALIGVVADPTAAEISERRGLDAAQAGVLVEWPHHRHWEDRACIAPWTTTPPSTGEGTAPGVARDVPTAATVDGGPGRWAEAVLPPLR